MVQHAPDEQHREFIFNSDVGAREEEVIVITYERKLKTPTLPRVMREKLKRN